MILKMAAFLLSLAITSIPSLRAQQAPPTSGDVTVRLSEPIAFATARPLQAVRSVVVSSTNPAVPAGSLAVLQLQNRDGSYTLKLLRIAAGGIPLKTMSQPGMAVNGGTASGQNASLPNGALVRFRLTQQDGSPGAPIQQAATSPPPAGGVRASAPGPKGGTTKDQAHFEIEDVKLGMTLSDLTAVAKTSGTPKITHANGATSVAFKTFDLEFNCQFTKTGILDSMEVYSIKKITGMNTLSTVQTAEASSRMYKKALEEFGRPDATDSDGATWKNPDGSSAAYFLDGDALEIKSNAS